jgi:hypothetical protein
VSANSSSLSLPRMLPEEGIKLVQTYFFIYNGRESCQITHILFLIIVGRVVHLCLNLCLDVTYPKP